MHHLVRRSPSGQHRGVNPALLGERHTWRAAAALAAILEGISPAAIAPTVSPVDEGGIIQ